MLTKTGSREDGERQDTAKKLPGILLEELGSMPERRKPLLHAKSLAITLAAMG